MAQGRQTGQHRTDSRDFFWRLLLTASLTAATVSLLTTGIGLDRYVSKPLAWSMAAAVQLGLFGLAWLIGSGREVRRWWIVSLYSITMLFSVTFSYVTLQSEFTKEIRPAEARRQLFDLSRIFLAEAVQQANHGVQQSADLELRLASWLDMERTNGWATRTCEEEEHCYLQGVCGRIGRRIERWQTESGQTYREGPGEQLIFGTLQTELRTLEQIGQRLGTYQGQLAAGEVLAGNVDNQERLRRLDGVLNQAPVDDLQAVTCQAVALPAPPSYSDHARDVAAEDEQPVYAFQDLITVLHAEGPLRPEDYPTLFALALALFIDLFVLVIALGAASLRDTPSDAHWLPFDARPASFEDALHRDIETWIDGALLDLRFDLAARQEFLTSVVGSVTFSSTGEAHLIPNDLTQRRFGHLLLQSKAARLEHFVKYNRMGRLFVLEEWVYPALSRHLGVILPRPEGQTSSSELSGHGLGQPAPAL